MSDKKYGTRTVASRPGMVLFLLCKYTAFAVVFLIFIPLGCTFSVLHMFSKAGYIWYKLLSNVISVIASPFACKITFEFGISFILTICKPTCINPVLYYHSKYFVLMKMILESICLIEFFSTNAVY